MQKKKFGVLLFMVVLAAFGYADSNVLISAPLGSDIPVNVTIENAPPLIEEINICVTGICSAYQAIDPATLFTLQLKISDGSQDLNYDSLAVKFYETSLDNTCAASWDCVSMPTVNYANGNGCTEGGDISCVTVSAGDWTTKFLAGGADVYASIKDLNGQSSSLELAYSADVNGILVNQTTGILSDTNTGIYSVDVNTTGTALFSGNSNPYLVITHNGNQSISVTNSGSDFTKGSDTITKENQKFNLDNNYFGATAIDGSAQSLKTSWGRGTYPTYPSQNVFYWLDCPAYQAAGNYSGVITLNSS